MELSDFLKKYSTISNDFIDEFMSIHNPNTSQTDFTINIDIVSKWLEISKRHLLETLKYSYKKTIDYIIEKDNRPKTTKYGANNKKIYLLTPDAFKRICMRSKSPKSEDVRTYYIQLESLVLKYSQQMVDGMQLEIDRLEKALKPKTKADKVGYIYVIKASEHKDSVYKIGRTKDLTSRISTYQTGHLEEVEVVMQYRTDSVQKVEQCIKLMLKKHQLRKYKEIYQVNIDIIKKIISGCDNLSSITKEVFTLRKPTTMTGGYYVYLQAE
jgi:phage anti-repressor protein